MDCNHCGVAIWEAHDEDHPGMCCDCFDLSCGMPLEQLNAERAKAGRPAITKPWARSTNGSAT